MLPSHDNCQVQVLHRLHTEETAGEPLEISARHPTDVCSTVGHAKGIDMDVMWAEADYTANEVLARLLVTNYLLLTNRM